MKFFLVCLNLPSFKITFSFNFLPQEEKRIAFLKNVERKKSCKALLDKMRAEAKGTMKVRLRFPWFSFFHQPVQSWKPLWFSPAGLLCEGCHRHAGKWCEAAEDHWWLCLSCLYQILSRADGFSFKYRISDFTLSTFWWKIKLSLNLHIGFNPVQKKKKNNEPMTSDDKWWRSVFWISAQFWQKTNAPAKNPKTNNLSAFLSACVYVGSAPKVLSEREAPWQMQGGFLIVFDGEVSSPWFFVQKEIRKSFHVGLVLFIRWPRAKELGILPSFPIFPQTMNSLVFLIGTKMHG